ncbi:thymidine phosphorylase, partial [bacterium]|nr:thymidine phosphorylase [bacterium]
MKVVDIIQKKKEGREHTKEEIYFLVNSYIQGKTEDYQMSAWLMAVCFQGLSEKETLYLTQSYIDSGEVLDFSSISSFVADKHSTGGVGDKVTLVLIPILAALNITCAKLSGRGLGYTGGTIDKLESIPNFNVELTPEAFKAQIKKIGAAISSQSPNLTPADGKIYALRDVTATVDNASLIAASVVSKKVASGANSIVLDVTWGKGAFIKNLEEAQKLGNLMVKIGHLLNRKVDFVVSPMNEPLGFAIGNSLEVIEAIDFLKGKKIDDLYNITLEIVHKTLLNYSKVSNILQSKELMDKVINEGSALQKLKEIISAQKGCSEVIEDYSLFKNAKNVMPIKAQKSATVKELDALKIAKCAK